MSAYHRISKAVRQAPTEYMGGGATHITDYDPESGDYGSARYERRESPPAEEVDRWVIMFNSGVPSLEISRRTGYPYLTVQNEIARHPAKSRGAESTVPIAVYLTSDLARRVEEARVPGEPVSKLVLELLERGVGGERSKAAAKEPTEAEVGRWVRMHQRGLSPSQIAEAVGRYPREVSKAIRSRTKAKPRRRTEGTPLKLSLRMPLWLKKLLDAAAKAAGIKFTMLIRNLLDRELPA